MERSTKLEILPTKRGSKTLRRKNQSWKDKINQDDGIVSGERGEGSWVAVEGREWKRLHIEHRCVLRIVVVHLSEIVNVWS
mmetsp:Transcript_4301/g.7432  ORF Transcript_4301/g.7432 Transcript_4301/m.7432 type:complete len:81 (+) Transcript_4301:1133-1375(+)